MHYSKVTQHFIPGKFSDGIKEIWDYLEVVDAIDTTKNDGTCSNGFTSFSSQSEYCYLINARYGANWENANRFCNLKQGSLVMPKSKWQKDLIRYMITKNKQRGIGFWIGLRKHRIRFRSNLAKYNQWSWNDGSYLKSDGWKFWKNKRFRKQDCAMVSQHIRRYEQIYCMYSIIAHFLIS